MKSYILKDRKLSIISKVIIIITWILLSKLINNEVIFPTVKSTFISLIDIIQGPYFLKIIKFSLLRSFVGFLISLFLAMLIGILSSISKIVYNLMIPILNFLKSVPTMAIIILALIWINNEFAPMFVGFIMVFPILYEAVLNGILNIDKDIMNMAKLYKVDKITIIKDLYLPSILINLSIVITSTLGINLKMVIAGEALAQPEYAIGSNLQLQKTYLNTSGVFAWIIIILLIAKVFEYMVKAIKYLLGENRWK
jgi:NitT/TauT family transport system permease protein